MPTIANGNPFSTLCAETESKKKKTTLMEPRIIIKRYQLCAELMEVLCRSYKPVFGVQTEQCLNWIQNRESRNEKI